MKHIVLFALRGLLGGLLSFLSFLFLASLLGLVNGVFLGFRLVVGLCSFLACHGCLVVGLLVWYENNT